MSNKLGLSAGRPSKANDKTSTSLSDIFKDSPEGEEAHTLWLSVADITISAQVREEFEDEENSLQDLADHIKANGLMQPILVRPGTFGRYELVAGERRLRAHKIANLLTIPAYVRELTDEQAEDAQFAENIHRKNLTQIEEVKKIQRDLDKLGSVEAVLKKYNKNRGWLSKMLSLLNLPEQAKRLISENISADTEVINQVKTIEKIDPKKAKEVVEKLKATRGRENARDLVSAAKDVVKPSNKLGVPVLKEKTVSPSDLIKATKKDRSAEDPSQVISIFPSLPVKPATKEEKLLLDIFAKVTKEDVNPQAVFDSISAVDLVVIEKQLSPYFDEGVQATVGASVILKHLRSGVFGSDGISAFALLAFFQGLEKKSSLDMLAALQTIHS